MLSQQDSNLLSSGTTGEASQETLIEEVEFDLAVIDYQLSVNNTPPTQTRQAARKPSLLSPLSLLYLIALAYAMTEASQSAMGMKDEEPALAYSCIALTFLYSLTMNGKTIVDGFKELLDLVKTGGELPANLPPISTQQKRAGIAIATLIAIYVATSDAFQAIFYSKALPNEYDFDDTGWAIPTAIMAISTALTTIFSEGFKTYLLLHEMMAGKTSTHYDNRLSRILSPVIGNLLAVISGMSDFLATSVGMCQTSKAEDRALIYALIALSTINGISEASLQRYYAMSVTDSIISTLATRRPTLKELTSATIGLGLSGYVAIATQKLTLKLLTTFGNLNGIHSNSGLETSARIFSHIIAINYVLLGGIYLYPFITKSIDALNFTITYTYENLLSPAMLRVRDLEMARPAQDEDEHTPLTRSHSINYFSIFARPHRPPRLGMRQEDELAAAGYRIK